MNSEAHATGKYVSETRNGVPVDVGGNLKLSIIKGQLLHDKDSVGKMDPYVIIDFNAKT